MKKKLAFLAIIFVVLSQTAGACGNTTIILELEGAGTTPALTASTVYDDKQGGVVTTIETLPWVRKYRIKNEDARNLYIHFKASHPTRPMFCTMTIDGEVVKLDGPGNRVDCSFTIPNSHEAK